MNRPDENECKDKLVRFEINEAAAATPMKTTVDPTAALKNATQLYAVLDFEATCEESQTIHHQEIIEVPVLLLRATDGEQVGKFHSYVRPVCNPVLTAFCVKLTGITQETVDHAEPFAVVLRNLTRFLSEHGVARGNTTFVTCGDWDLQTMLPAQCKLSGVACPSVFRRWVNIKKEYRRHCGVKVISLMDMVEKAGLTHLGRWHSGIDDCVNVAQVLRRMIAQGYTGL
jgi:inhibitor of KinA sporulation pathway (predicted exonuclease)